MIGLASKLLKTEVLLNHDALRDIPKRAKRPRLLIHLIHARVRRRATSRMPVIVPRGVHDLGMNRISATPISALWGVVDKGTNDLGD